MTCCCCGGCCCGCCCCGGGGCCCCGGGGVPLLGLGKTGNVGVAFKLLADANNVIETTVEKSANKPIFREKFLAIFSIFLNMYYFDNINIELKCYVICLSILDLFPLRPPPVLDTSRNMYTRL